jgi:hypothetical protein
VEYAPMTGDACIECGTQSLVSDTADRCPACFDRYLAELDVGFLDNYRKFGVRSHLVVAETCLRGLVLDSPDHRKVLAMTIFEQYVKSMSDLAGLFTAFINRHRAPIIKTFMEFKLDARAALDFYHAIETSSDDELCRLLNLPMPRAVEEACPHLDRDEAYSLSVSIHQLLQELRKATDMSGPGALALAQIAGQVENAVMTGDVEWLNGSASRLTPDQVALLILDPRTRSLYVQGLTADENAMGRVVDAIDTVTRASSNLIFSYLQTNNL